MKRSGRDAGLHPEHGQRRPGLGHVSCRRCGPPERFALWACRRRRSRVHAFPLISGLRTISGNPTGSPPRLREMLDVAARHGVKAKTELFPMAKANEAIEKVKKNKVRYRAVLAN